MEAVPTDPTVDAPMIGRPPASVEGSRWAEEELARRAALILAAAREEHLREALGGLVGDLVEAAAVLALAVLGERGMLRAEPTVPERWILHSVSP